MNQTPDTEQRVLEALAKVPLASQLDEKSRRKLARLCTLKSFEVGDVLYEEGAMGLGLFIVTSGRVEISKGTKRQKVRLETVGAGGVLGQLALLDNQPRAATAVALEATECLLVTRDSFDTLLKKEPQIAWCLMPGLAARVRELQKVAMAAQQKKEPAPKAAAGKPEAEEAKAADKEADEAGEDDEEESSEIESALYKMMRMQYGCMAGAAKGMTQMAKAMESFLDSMAEETDFKTKEDWGDLMGKIPDAMVSATRSVMDECEKIPEEMLDAYRRYSEADN